MPAGRGSPAPPDASLCLVAAAASLSACAFSASEMMDPLIGPFVLAPFLALAGLVLFGLALGAAWRPANDGARAGVLLITFGSFLFGSLALTVPMTFLFMALQGPPGGGAYGEAAGAVFFALIGGAGASAFLAGVLAFAGARRGWFLRKKNR